MTVANTYALGRRQRRQRFILGACSCFGISSFKARSRALSVCVPGAPAGGAGGVCAGVLRPPARKRGVRDGMGEHGVGLRHVHGGDHHAFERGRVSERDGQQGGLTKTAAVPAVRSTHAECSLAAWCSRCLR